MRRLALADRAENRDAADAESPADRIARWQRKLLDLTLRNRLLNFRNTSGTIELNIPDLAAFEDLLARGTHFSVLPKADANQMFLREEVDAGHVHTTEAPGEHGTRLLKLYRTAKSSI